ncbi:hypothetical protein BD309DRAFT_1048024 [Dichomitus squalens]|nr:hypothetical protein BD309DRAFT_1048024 [Dichomitus squalens]
MNHEVFIGYLMRYMVMYEDDGNTPPPKELLPEERVILSELQTEDARWYMGVYLGERRMLSLDEIKEYSRRKVAKLDPPTNGVLSGGSAATISNDM